MAQGTVLREPGCGVVRIGGVVVGGGMAGGTVLRSSGKYIVDMACRARQRCMCPGQHETGRGIVVEFRAGPLSGRVAQRTGLRKTGSDVVRITAGGKISGMARGAISRRSRKAVVNVTVCARDRRVCPGQWERCFGVIELRPQPLRRRMA